MKRRLTEAYDAMIMPDDCTRRIEEQLEARQRRRNVEIYTPPKRNWWAMAAGLVCLVLVLSAGGTFLFLNAANHTAAKTPAPAVTMPSVLETKAEPALFILTEEDRAFLADMCYSMPDWDDYGSLDDEFWNDFVYSSFTNPNLSGEGKALTVCGEAECVSAFREDLGRVETQVKISREKVNDYVNLTMGCGLPEDFRPSREGLSYADGYFYVSLSDLGSLGFTFRQWEFYVKTNNTYGFVYFNCYMGKPENVVGSVVFTVCPAENENGFTVIGKKTKFIDDEDRQAIHEVVSAFAEAYFAADAVKMQEYLEEGFAWQVEGYPGNKEDVSIKNILGFAEIKQRQIGDVEIMAVEFLDAPGSDSLTYLTMELVKQEDGWKVKSYGLEK